MDTRSGRITTLVMAMAPRVLETSRPAQCLHQRRNASGPDQPPEPHSRFHPRRTHPTRPAFQWPLHFPRCPLQDQNRKHGNRASALPVATQVQHAFHPARLLQHLPSTPCRVPICDLDSSSRNPRAWILHVRTDRSRPQGPNHVLSIPHRPCRQQRTHPAGRLARSGIPFPRPPPRHLPLPMNSTLDASTRVRPHWTIANEAAAMCPTKATAAFSTGCVRPLPSR